MEDIKLAIGVYREGCKVRNHYTSLMKYEDDIISVQSSIYRLNIEGALKRNRKNYPNAEIMVADENDYCYRIKDYVLLNKERLIDLIYVLISLENVNQVVDIVTDDSIDDGYFTYDATNSIVYYLVKNNIMTDYTVKFIELCYKSNRLDANTVTKRLFNNIGIFINNNISNSENYYKPIVQYIKDYAPKSYQDIIFADLDNYFNNSIYNLNNSDSFYYIMAVKHVFDRYNDEDEKEVIDAMNKILDFGYNEEDSSPINDYDINNVIDNDILYKAIKLLYNANMKHDISEILPVLNTDSVMRIYDIIKDDGWFNKRLKRIISDMNYDIKMSCVYENLFDMNIDRLNTSSELINLLYYTSCMNCVNRYTNFISTYNSIILFIDNSIIEEHMSTLMDILGYVLKYSSGSKLTDVVAIINTTIAKLESDDELCYKYVTNILDDFLQDVGTSVVTFVYYKIIYKHLSNVRFKNPTLKRAILEEKLKR